MSFMSKLKIMKKGLTFACISYVTFLGCSHSCSVVYKKKNQHARNILRLTHSMLQTYVWGFNNLRFISISSLLHLWNFCWFYPLKSIDLIWVVYLLQVMTTLCAYDSIQWRIFTQKLNIARSQKTCNHS